MASRGEGKKVMCNGNGKNLLANKQSKGEIRSAEARGKHPVACKRRGGGGYLKADRGERKKMTCNVKGKKLLASRDEGEKT